MDIAELEMERADLLPDRKALGCWNYGGHGWYGGGSYGYTSLNLNISLNLNLSSQFGGYGW